MAETHGVERVKRELFFPKVDDRSLIEEWVSSGSKDARQRAREIAKDILAEHKPLPIPSEIDKRIKNSIPGLIV